MAKAERPIRLEFARKIFRLLLDAIDIGCIDLSDHFVQRMKERSISMADLEPVIRKGHVAKEHPPREDDSDFRWSLTYKEITVVFKVPADGCPRIFFKTCWRGKPPQGENP